MEGSHGVSYTAVFHLLWWLSNNRENNSSDFFGLMLKWMYTFTYQIMFTGLLRMSGRATRNQEPQVMSLESALVGAKKKELNLSPP